MEPETLEALWGSIKKWEAVVAGTGLSLGCDNCPLCHRFMQRYFACRRGLEKCPVYERTGAKYCKGTPHDSYVDDPSQAIAKEELDFLRSLLPEGV